MKILDKILDSIGLQKKEQSFSTTDPYLARVMKAYFSNTKLTDPYVQVPTVRACVRAKASNIAQVPLKIYNNNDDEVTKGPIVELFNDVNPYLSKHQLWEAIVHHLDLYGDAPIIKDRQQRKGVPVYIWPFHPNKVKEVIKNDVLNGWKVYQGRTDKIYYPDEVILPKYFNPNNNIRGLSLVSALEKTLSTEWGAIRFNEIFYKNGSHPGEIFTTEEALDDVQFARLKAELIEPLKGVDNFHQSLLLDAGVKPAKTAPSNKDMQFLDLRKFTREEIAMIFKVPKAELGLYEDVNYATALSADLSFWKKTLLPIMSLIVDKFNTDLLNELGYYCKFDLSAVDVLNREVLEKAETAKIYWEMGIPFNDINRRLNLGFDEKPELDLGKYDLLSSIREQHTEPTKTIKELDKSVIDKYRENKYKSLMQPVLPVMGKTAKAVREYVFSVEQKLLKEITKNFGSIKTKLYEEQDLVESYFSDTELRKALRPFLLQALQIGKNSIQVDWDIPDTAILDVLDKRLYNLSQINKTAVTEINDKLKDIFDTAIREGLTESETQDLVVEGLRGKIKNIKSRAKTIARTEIHGIYTEGRYRAAAETKPTHKTWISTYDDKVRDNHMNMNGEKVTFESKFSNGLRYPLDSDNGQAKDKINCRCAVTFQYEENKQ